MNDRFKFIKNFEKYSACTNGHKYYEKDKGCATCCSNACHDALKKNRGVR